MNSVVGLLRLTSENCVESRIGSHETKIRPGGGMEPWSSVETLLKGDAEQRHSTGRIAFDGGDPGQQSRPVAERVFESLLQHPCGRIRVARSCHAQGVKSSIGVPLREFLGE